MNGSAQIAMLIFENPDFKSFIATYIVFSPQLNSPSKDLFFWIIQSKGGFTGFLNIIYIFYNSELFLFLRNRKILLYQQVSQVEFVSENILSETS